MAGASRNARHGFTSLRHEGPGRSRGRLLRKPDPGMERERSPTILGHSAGNRSGQTYSGAPPGAVGTLPAPALVLHNQPQPKGATHDPEPR